ncbi:MAG: thermonuclease family protein, partial [Burkholderiales bacterium]|nr:thermonuclease family protein [Burkholderiales bacterium]
MRHAALLLALLSFPALADGLLHGIVVSVADGDTIRFETAHGGRIKVRLAQIDAPEKSQPGGKASQVSLGEMCMQQPATLAIIDQDRYGRLVA